MSLHTLPKWTVVLLVAVFLLLPSSRVLAADPGTAFTYQGRLTSSGSDVNQSCDFQFSLYDASSSGSQVGSTLTKSSVSVSEGRFNTSLGFGSSAFTGSAGFLEIAVRCPASSGSYTTLSPRQELTPTPYAITAGGLDADGAKLTLDADDDTSITVDTDDQIDIEIAGSDEFIFTAGVLDIGNGTLGRIDLDADNDTSIRSSADDQIDFETSGTDRVVIDSSGQVGIGTSSPTQTLDVSGTARFTGATLGVSGSTTLADSVVIDTTDSTFSTSVMKVTTSVTSSGNTVFNLDAGGNLSLDGQLTLGSDIKGTSSYMFAILSGDDASPNTNTDVVWDNVLGSSGVTLGTNTGIFTLEANKNYVLEAALQFVASGATGQLQYRWTDTSNNALVTGGGDAEALPPTFASHVSQQPTARAFVTTTSAKDVKLRINAATAETNIESDRAFAFITEVGTTDSILSSDQRLKTNIQPLASISDDLAQLQPVLFDWRSQEYPHLGLGTGRQLGLVAQDVEKVFPELVTEGQDGFKRVSYEHIPMLLLQGMREQQARIEQLARQNNALKGLVCGDHPDADACQRSGSLSMVNSHQRPDPGWIISPWLLVPGVAGLATAAGAMLTAYLRTRRTAIADQTG